jgi:hypothetical protein
MPDKGTPTPGGDAGAKISDTKSGVVTIKPVSPKAPQQPVRH